MSAHSLVVGPGVRKALSGCVFDAMCHISLALFCSQGVKRSKVSRGIETHERAWSNGERRKTLLGALTRCRAAATRQLHGRGIRCSTTPSARTRRIVCSRTSHSRTQKKSVPGPGRSALQLSLSSGESVSRPSIWREVRPETAPISRRVQKAAWKMRKCDGGERYASPNVGEGAQPRST